MLEGGLACRAPGPLGEAKGFGLFGLDLSLRGLKGGLERGSLGGWLVEVVSLGELGGQTFLGGLPWCCGSYMGEGQRNGKGPVRGLLTPFGVSAPANEVLGVTSPRPSGFA